MRNLVLVTGAIVLVGVCSLVLYKISGSGGGEASGARATVPNADGVQGRVEVTKRRERRGEGAAPGGPLPSFTRPASGIVADDQLQRLPGETQAAQSARTAKARLYREFLEAAALDESQKAGLRRLVADFRREVDALASSSGAGSTREDYVSNRMAEEDRLSRSFRQRLRVLLSERQYQEFHQRFLGDLVLHAATGVFDQSS